MRKSIDTYLAIAVVTLTLFGLVMVYSASVIKGLTLPQADPAFFFKRHLVYIILGLGSMAVLSNIDYKFWQKHAKWMLLASLLLLLSVFLFSKGNINGAQRWIILGGFSFQPAEVVKFTFLAYLSAWFCQRKDSVANFKETFIPFIGICAVISFLMLQQPDFGTLTVMLISAAAVYWTAGMSWKHLGLTLLIAGIGLAGALSVPYRRARIVAFLNQNQTTQVNSGQPKDAAVYHSDNINIAIGSGGWFGLGFGESKQKRLFLPEPQTDSIFAIIVEELGFLISTLLIGLITFVLYRVFRIAETAPDMFSKLLVTGVASWLAYQSMLNLAAMLQLAPLKGIPLPFVSYGGTNIIVTLATIGVVLNISRQRKLAGEVLERNPLKPRKSLVKKRA
jgi:cell division protein FtsW